jgi:hypothetical protein
MEEREERERKKKAMNIVAGAASYLQYRYHI